MLDEFEVREAIQSKGNEEPLFLGFSCQIGEATSRYRA